MDYFKTLDKKLTEQFGPEHLQLIVNSSIVSLLLFEDRVIGFFTKLNCLSIKKFFLKRRYNYVVILLFYQKEYKNATYQCAPTLYSDTTRNLIIQFLREVSEILISSWIERADKG